MDPHPPLLRLPKGFFVSIHVDLLFPTSARGRAGAGARTHTSRAKSGGQFQPREVLVNFRQPGLLEEINKYFPQEIGEREKYLSKSGQIRAPALNTKVNSQQVFQSC